MNERQRSRARGGASPPTRAPRVLGTPLRAARLVRRRRRRRGARRAARTPRVPVRGRRGGVHRGHHRREPLRAAPRAGAPARRGHDGPARADRDRRPDGDRALGGLRGHEPDDGRRSPRRWPRRSACRRTSRRRACSCSNGAADAGAFGEARYAARFTLHVGAAARRRSCSSCRRSSRRRSSSVFGSGDAMHEVLGRAASPSPPRRSDETVLGRRAHRPHRGRERRPGAVDADRRRGLGHAAERRPGPGRPARPPHLPAGRRSRSRTSRASTAPTSSCSRPQQARQLADHHDGPRGADRAPASSAEIELSAVCEAMNQMMGAATNILADTLTMAIEVAPPTCVVMASRGRGARRVRRARVLDAVPPGLRPAHRRRRPARPRRLRRAPAARVRGRRPGARGGRGGAEPGGRAAAGAARVQAASRSGRTASCRPACAP